MAIFPETQVMFLLVGSGGSIVGINRVVESTFNVTKTGHRLILITGVLTVTNEDAEKFPSSDVTIIEAEPSATPETIPLALTVAIVVSLELH